MMRKSEFIAQWYKRTIWNWRARRNRRRRLFLTARAYSKSEKVVRLIEQSCTIHHAVMQNDLDEINATEIVDMLLLAAMYELSIVQYYEAIGQLFDEGYRGHEAFRRYRINLAALIYGGEDKDDGN